MTNVSDVPDYIDQAREPKCGTTKTSMNGGDVKFKMRYYYTLSPSGQPEEENIFTAKGRLPQNDHRLLVIDEFISAAGVNAKQEDFVELIRRLA